MSTFITKHYIDILTTSTYSLLKEYIKVSYERDKITEKERDKYLSQLQKSTDKLLYNKKPFNQGNIMTEDICSNCNGNYIDYSIDTNIETGDSYIYLTCHLCGHQWIPTNTTNNGE